MVNPFISIINQCLPEPQAGLLNGILFGIRSHMPADFYQALINTGTVHVVALSGQNISILTRVLAEISLIFGRRISSLLTVFGICLFVFFVGPEPTIIRAAIMGSLTLLAVYFGRQSWSLLSLILAAGIMLIINPAWMKNLSFQLSFLATSGIILFASTKTQKANNLWDELKRDTVINLRTTIAAQVFTVPLIFYVFKRVSLIAPLANVLIAWTITPIMILGFAVGILGGLHIWLGKIVGWLVWAPLTYLVKVVELAAKIPYASVAL